MPGLFKQGNGERQRPGGVTFNWLESFLLPEEDSEGSAPSSADSGGKKSVWIGDLEQALARAEKENKLVFIDFTGQTCQNCKINERSIFPRPDIRELLSQYVLLRLYCDTVPPGFAPNTNGPDNQRFRDEAFKSAQLPLYVIIKPTGGKFETIAIYPEGKINFPDKFAEFLRQPLKK